MRTINPLPPDSLNAVRFEFNGFFMCADVLGSTEPGVYIAQRFRTATRTFLQYEVRMKNNQWVGKFLAEVRATI